MVQRGNNHQAIFFDDNDYRVYLDWLLQAAKRYDCMIHAYVLMTNHVHILLTPATQHAISAMMQYLGRHYVPYINRVYHRSGTLWEGRFKAHLVQEQRYLLACYRHIELNPVCAGMVASPSEYPCGTPLGNDRFRAQIEQQLGRKVGYAHRGRLRNDPTEIL